jgi:tRNA (guanine37-N1)-methyltransferase
MTWHASVLTLYPEMFPGPLGLSLAGRARAEGIWSLEAVQIRDFATDRHRSVDDTPAGGGAGMVMRADVLGAAVDDVLTRAPDAPMLAMTPRGEPLTQALVRQLAGGPGVVILCGARGDGRTAVRGAADPARVDRRLCAFRWRMGAWSCSMLAFGCSPA